uniref:Uncharacterized protein n=1 Tax=Octopus bimaculoides TaxID=37653 RepID=A0A0L8GE94_OCTBM
MCEMSLDSRIYQPRLICSGTTHNICLSTSVTKYLYIQIYRLYKYTQIRLCALLLLYTE